MRSSFISLLEKRRVKGCGDGDTKVGQHRGSSMLMLLRLGGIHYLLSLVRISCVGRLLSF